MTTKDTVSPDDAARAYRMVNFAVRAEPGRFPEFDSEKTVYVTYNGRQEYPIPLAPHEARKLFDLLAAEFGFAPPAAAPVAEPFAWIAAMPDGQHDGGDPYLYKDEADDYIENRAIPGCYLVPLVRTDRAAPVAELASAPRHTYASIANSLIGKHRDESNTEYVTLADAEAAVRAASKNSGNGLPDALRLINDLSRISMSLAADLVKGADYTFKGHDYLDRNAVVDRVMQWRSEWDALAPARAALAPQRSTGSDA